MATENIDFGTGANTQTGDLFPVAIARLLGRTTALTAPPVGGIAPLRLGQQDLSYSYYTQSDFARDKARAFTLINSDYTNVPQTPGGIGGYDENGYVNSYVNGQTFIRYKYTGFWAKLGTYTLAYPRGMTATPGVTLANSYVYGPEYDIDTAGPNNRGRKVTVLTNRIDTGEVIFSGVPTARTATTMAFRPSLTFDGDPTPNILVTDEAVSSFKALRSKIFRSMDARKTNFNLEQHTLTNTQNFFFMGLPMMASLCNESGQDLWFNHWVYQDDDAVRAEYDYIAANLRSDLNVFIEYGNEPWNTNFSQSEELMILGLEAGYATASNSADAVAFPKFGRFSGTFVGQTGQTPAGPLPVRNIAVGETFVGNRFGSGLQVWRALQNITANDTNAILPHSTNAYWQVLFNFNQGTTAKIRWVSKKTADITRIAQSAFTAAGKDLNRLLPILQWQAVASFSAVQPGFDFDNNYNIFKRYATAPYWGNFMGNYNGQHFGTWTATQKALYLTDTAACMDYFFANVNQDIDATIARQLLRKNELAAYVASKGLPANGIQLAAYELNNHTEFNAQGGWTDSAKRGAMQDALQVDPRFGDATAYFIKQYRNIIGGDAVWYGRCGFTTKPWTSQVNELDRTSVQMAALMANA